MSLVLLLWTCYIKFIVPWILLNMQHTTNPFCIASKTSFVNSGICLIVMSCYIRWWSWCHLGIIDRIHFRLNSFYLVVLNTPTLGQKKKKKAFTGYTCCQSSFFMLISSTMVFVAFSIEVGSTIYILNLLSSNWMPFEILLHYFLLHDLGVVGSWFVGKKKKYES